MTEGCSKLRVPKTCYQAGAQNIFQAYAHVLTQHSEKVQFLFPVSSPEQTHQLS